MYELVALSPCHATSAFPIWRSVFGITAEESEEAPSRIGHGAFFSMLFRPIKLLVETSY